MSGCKVLMKFRLVFNLTTKTGFNILLKRRTNRNRNTHNNGGYLNFECQIDIRWGAFTRSHEPVWHSIQTSTINAKHMILSVQLTIRKNVTKSPILMRPTQTNVKLFSQKLLKLYLWPIWYDFFLESFLNNWFENRNVKPLVKRAHFFN